MLRYQVGMYVRGLFDSIVSGMGKNRGKWDACHSRSAAYRHAKKLREANRNDAITYRVLKG